MWPARPLRRDLGIGSAVKRAVEGLGHNGGSRRLLSVAVELEGRIDPVRFVLSLADLDRPRSLAKVAEEAIIAGAGEAAGRPVPIAFGGFSFSPHGGTAGRWREFGSARVVVPRVLVASRSDRPATLVVSTLLEPGELPAEAVTRTIPDLLWFAEKPILPYDPFLQPSRRIESALLPAHYEAAVQRAKELIASGAARKLVIAREVIVHSSRRVSVPTIYDAMRQRFPSCFNFLISTGGGATFFGASPELLVRREGLRLTTMALAGSTRRSADPAVDRHFGEQLLRSATHREEHGIVVQRIVGELERHALWATAAEEPTIGRVANSKHHATAIRAQRAEPVSVIEAAGWLHPTPAVGGEPKEAALELIPTLEGFDRGWYTGPVGFCDANGEGEFCVALRCVLAADTEARCFVGNGIVRDSDPAAELAETELKLQAMLSLLTG